MINAQWGIWQMESLSNILLNRWVIQQNPFKSSSKNTLLKYSACKSIPLMNKIPPNGPSVGHLHCLSVKITHKRHIGERERHWEIDTVLQLNVRFNLITRMLWRPIIPLGAYFIPIFSIIADQKNYVYQFYDSHNICDILHIM